MAEIVNLTPHDVLVVDPDGSRRVFPSAGKARVSESVSIVAEIDGIPLVEKRYLEATGLPPPRSGTLYVVSYYTRACCPDRDDLLIPHDLVRDGAGNIIGCRAFSIRENVRLIAGVRGEDGTPTDAASPSVTEPTVLLAELLRGHDLRAQPLGAVGAECRNKLSKEWKKVARWRIAAYPYDDLGTSWTDTSEFRAPINV